MLRFMARVEDIDRRRQQLSTSEDNRHGSRGSFRSRIQGAEKGMLAPAGTHSYSVTPTGRVVDEPKCDMRTPFQRDRDRIVHSKAFRRLMHKTQVFISPDSEHLRTRLTHSLEVMQIARTIARSIGANEDLTEAIALGHDLGHTPFGHKGQAMLSKCLKDNGFSPGFEHAVQSWRIVSYLERYPRFEGGQGINLTAAVRFGILRHSGRYSDGSPDADYWDRWGEKRHETFKQTLEEKIVRVSDDIAWLNHDWDDGVRSGLLSNSFLGRTLVDGLGVLQADRINTMVRDVAATYRRTGKVRFGPEVDPLKLLLRQRIEALLWNCDIVFSYNREAQDIIGKLFAYFLRHWDDLPESTKGLLEQAPTQDLKYKALIVSDYISGMTDEYALRTYETFIYSPYSRFRQLPPGQEANWIQPAHNPNKNAVTYTEGNVEWFDIVKPERLHIENGARFGVFELPSKHSTETKLGPKKADAVYEGTRMHILGRHGASPILIGDALIVLD